MNAWWEAQGRDPAPLGHKDLYTYLHKQVKVKLVKKQSLKHNDMYNVT